MPIMSQCRGARQEESSYGRSLRRCVPRGRLEKHARLLHDQSVRDTDERVQNALNVKHEQRGVLMADPTTAACPHLDGYAPLSPQQLADPFTIWD